MKEGTVVDEDVSCYHCGDQCGKNPIEAFDKHFCCHGCKTVYELLNENDLCTYYDFEEQPGIKVENSLDDKYSFLDNPEIEKRLLEFSDAGISKVKFFVPKIHCSSCIWLLENLQKLNSGIVQSHVNFLKKEVYVTYRSEEVALRAVVELMASIGYEPTLSSGDFSKKTTGGSNKTFLYKLGLAGFCFGNIMLLSFPEYLSDGAALDRQYKLLFGYLNLILALPVLVYSANEYFISAYKSLRKGFVNIDLPISIGIIALFGRSAFEIITVSGAGFMDSFTMLVFLLLVGKWYQNKTYQALSFNRDYQSYFPVAVHRVSGNTESAVPIDQLQVNDVLALRSQEIVPADAELLDERAEVDYSFVTGESEPITKIQGETIFAGGRIVGKGAVLQVIRPVSQSYLTRLWNQDAFYKEHSAMNSIVNRVSKYFTLFILTVAVITFMYWYGTDPTMAFKTFTAVLIIACPCALALTLPFTFGNSLRIYGKHKLYLKNAEVVEQLAAVDTVIFDKTGTLTQNIEAKVAYHGQELSPRQQAHIKAIVKTSTHPLSKAIASSLDTPTEVNVDELRELKGKGLDAKIDGMHYRIGSGYWLGANEERQTLSSTVYIEVGGELYGYFEVRKKYRGGLSDVLTAMNSDYDLHLLSGDNDRERLNLTTYFGESNMRFKQQPIDKLNYVEQLQGQQKTVLMIGDGLNDAGALKQADVGIALSDDVYNFSPACDAILDAESFERLHHLIGYAKRAMKIVRVSFVISLAYNLIGLSFAIQGWVTPLFAAVLMPLSSITVVAFITLATNLSANPLKSRAGKR